MTWQSFWRAVTRHRELALGVTFVGVAGWELIEYLALERANGNGPLPLTLHALQVLMGLGITWLVVRAWQARTRHEEALARMVEKVVMAQEEERRRIAYDLHDGIAQLIVSAKQHVDTSRDVIGHAPAGAARELDRAAERLEGAIVETRRVLRALRPTAVDSVGLAEAMRRAVDDAAHEAGWAARFVDDLGDARLPAAVETAAFRILQESLANASRHARGTSIEVAVRRRAGWLHLDVRDDGIGFGHRPDLGNGRGLGLAGMQERARLLGGTCRIKSHAGRGTSISLALPLGQDGATS
jgi:signal transduction histidine kinase